MEKIQRYTLDNPFHHFHPTRFYDINGQWCLYEDVANLEAERNKLKWENEKLWELLKILENGLKDLRIYSDNYKHLRSDGKDTEI